VSNFIEPCEGKMAIQLPVNQTVFGVSFPDAYHRIVVAFVERQRDDAEKFRAVIELATYAVDPGETPAQPVVTRRYSAPISQVEAHDGPSFLQQCYQWIMAQPDMAGSVAV
jgi:hypothetical protein